MVDSHTKLDSFNYSASSSRYLWGPTRNLPLEEELRSMVLCHPNRIKVYSLLTHISVIDCDTIMDRSAAIIFA